MKKNCFITTIVIAGILIVMSCAGPEKPDSQEVKLTVLNSLERINQNDALRWDNEASIKAAKNEYESFQVVVSAIQKNIRVIKAEMSDLTGNAGTIGKENITLFREEYARVRRSSGRAQLPPGLYPDPLVPVINQVTGQQIEPYSQTRERWGGPTVIKGYEMYALPFEVWKGQNQPLWVDVFVPKNAAAGEYKGTFTLTMSAAVRTFGPKDDTIKNTVLTLPVSLTVWDFTLPDGPTHRNHFGNFRGIARVFGVGVNSDTFRNIEMQYCKMMAEHRINPPLPASLLPEINENGSLKITPERTEALKKFINDLHVTDFEIPRAPIKDMTTTNRDKAIRYYKDYYKYVKDNGWDKQSYLYMLDEPNLAENYQNVLDLGALVHSAAPEMKCLVVEQPYTQDPTWPDMDPAVDIWCPLFAFIDRDSINEKLAQGDEVWSYTALSQRAPLYHPKYKEVKNYDSPYWHIDALLTSYRTPTWMNYQYKINGLLYWSVVTITSSKTGTSDPWFNPAYKSSGNHDNGGGYMMYPGVPCGIEGPVSSIRFKVLRESMEDYEYLAILDKLAGRDAVLKIVNEVAPNWWATSEDPKMILAAREKVAAEILKLKK
jgi:hypothetical protein